MKLVRYPLLVLTDCSINVNEETAILIVGFDRWRPVLLTNYIQVFSWFIELNIFIFYFIMIGK